MLTRGYAMRQVLVLGAPFKCPHRHGNMSAFGPVDRDTSLRTLRFNIELKEECARLGCRFANPVDDLVDFSTQQVKPFFWAHPGDLHCAPRRVFPFWHRAIAEATGLKPCCVGGCLVSSRVLNSNSD